MEKMTIDDFKQELPIPNDGNCHNQVQNLIIQFGMLSFQKYGDQRNASSLLSSSTSECIWESAVFSNKSRFSHLSPMTPCKKKRVVLNKI